MMLKFKQSLSIILFLAVNVYAQLTGFKDDFANGSLDTLWNGTLFRLWDTEDTAIFHLSEQNGVLTIDYNRKSTDRLWPCFFFTPPQNIDVSVNPQITLKIKSNVTITYQFKPVYLNEKNDWKVVDIPGDNTWRIYSFNLDAANYSGSLMYRIYMHFDGGTQPNKSGTIWFDDLSVAGFTINISNLTAVTVDSSHIDLTWQCDKEANVSYYKIYRGNMSGFAPDAQTLVGTATTKNYTDGNLKNNTWYYYRVSAVDAAGVEYTPSPEVQCRTYSVGIPPVVAVADVNTTTVPLYDKFEIRLALREDSWSNPYDPDQIDVYALFYTPTGDSVRINAFYDNYQEQATWKIRFAPDQKGTWSYRIFARDQDGCGSSTLNSFTAVASDYHGCLRVAAFNPHYLTYHDGTPFYGIGAYYPWGVTNDEQGLDRLSHADGNFFAYWNGNYDGAGNGGGLHQIESVRAGIGHYDQQKCARIDEILSWAEDRNLMVMLALWPHDILDENTWGYNGWAQNAYRTICAAKEFYANAQSWEYQQKLYRYIIARWGYSRSLGIWELVNEINGTDGWAFGDQAKALTWVQKVHDFLKSHDPYQRPTTIAKSGGSSNYWPEGYRICDLPNVHLYENGWTPKFPSDPIRSSFWTYHQVARQFWNDFAKPGIFGEAGATSSSMYADVEDGSAAYAEIYHNALWASWSSGLAMTPVWWEMNSRSLMTDLVFARLKAFAQLAKGLNYASNRVQPTPVLVKDCDAFGMFGDSLGFGWIRAIQGDLKSDRVNFEDLNDGSYRLTWFDTWQGQPIQTKPLVSAFGESIDTIPAAIYAHKDIAYLLERIPDGTNPTQIHLFLSDAQIVPLSDTAYQVICIVCDDQMRRVPVTGLQINLQLAGPGTLTETILTTEAGMACSHYIPSGAIGTVHIEATAPNLASGVIDYEFANRLVIDDFEAYNQASELNRNWTTQIGASSSGTLSLSTDTVFQGLQSLKFKYLLKKSNSFAAILKTIDGNAYIGTKYLVFWLYPNLSGHTLNIGLRQSVPGSSTNLYWQVKYIANSTEPLLLQIPLEELKCTGSSGVVDLRYVNAFYINIVPGTGQLDVPSTIFIDAVALTYQKLSDIIYTDNQSRPHSFQLYPNYPNPFNSTTVIEYYLPTATPVKIEVYNLIGQVVATLVATRQSAGYQRVVWEAGNLPSGIYFIQFTSNDFFARRKCLLLK